MYMNAWKRSELNIGCCPTHSGKEYTTTAIQAQVKVLGWRR